MDLNLAQEFAAQRFGNGYQLVDGEAMHTLHGDQFQIPPAVLKRHVRRGHFVELRVDSPRFFAHEEDAADCSCPTCHGDMSKPVLRHENPATLVSLPDQSIPSRGWGEDFWVTVLDRQGDYLKGVVDNPLVESRLHGLQSGDEVLFHRDHILAIHDIHRRELVEGMNAAELKELVVWLGSQRRR